MFVLFSSFSFHLLCLLQSQHKRVMGGEYSVLVFNSTNVTLFYSICLCFILPLRRDNSKNTCAYSLQHNSSFQTNYWTILVLFLKGHIIAIIFKLNIGNFPGVLVSGSPLNPLRGSQCPQTPICIFPNSYKTQNLFPSQLMHCYLRTCIVYHISLIKEKNKTLSFCKFNSDNYKLFEEVVRI